MGKNCTKLGKDGIRCMPETKNELEARSVRFILEAVLSRIGELSDYLPYDPETLPFILKKIEQISKDLDEANKRAAKDREKRMKEMDSILGTKEGQEKDDLNKKTTCEECTDEELEEEARSTED